MPEEQAMQQIADALTSQPKPIHKVRGKFRCNSRTITQYGGIIINFYPVTADELPENVRFHKATPSGKLDIEITNPEAQSMFDVGKDYYLDFTRCESQV